MPLKTVWTPGAMNRIPHRWRAMYRIILPIIDGSLIAFGIGSFIVGSKIVEDFVPALRPAWALVILGGALVAFFGNAFLRKRTEFFGRLALVVGLLIYAVATIVYMLSGNDSSVLTLILIEVALVVITWRMWDIAEDVGTEEADREVIASRTGGSAAPC